MRVRPHEEVERLGSPYGIWVYRTIDDERPTAAIYISAAWPLEVQRYVLWHELQHAVVEGLDQMIEKFPEHVQTHSMAALAAAKAKELERKDEISQCGRAEEVGE